MLLRQIRHDLVGVARTPFVMIFAVGFPLAFFVVLAGLVGNETIDARSGVRVAQFLAPAFASFGVAMATFAFLAIGFAEVRFSGVLRRFQGSPLPPWVLLGGRVGAGTVLALASVVLLVVVGALAYDVQVLWARVPAVVVTVLVAAAAFSALGLALAALAPSLPAAIALANGLVIPLAFVSDLFVVGELPAALGAVGWWFPLRHLVNALADAFNPFLTGSGLEGAGWSLDHLAVIAAWGVAGALLAAWALRRDAADRPARTQPAEPADAEASVRTARAGRRPTHRAADALPRRQGRPTAAALLADQVRHAARVQWRDPSAAFFGLAFPVLFVVLLTTVNGGRDAVLADGTPVAQLLAATMSVYGAAVVAFVNTPQALAEARDARILQRWLGSPLPVTVLLAGRVLAAVALALLGAVLIHAVAVVVFGIDLPPTWPLALLVLAIATSCFAVLGLAVALVVPTAQSALAVCLGFLLLLSFFSDLFIVGAELPRPLAALSWVFPLRHGVHAVGNAAGVFEGSLLNAGHLGVLVGWAMLGAVVVAVRVRGGVLLSIRHKEPALPVDAP
jgi:ABC-type multidrug transport system permease subunit